MNSGYSSFCFRLNQGTPPQKRPTHTYIDLCLKTTRNQTPTRIPLPSSVPPSVLAAPVTLQNLPAVTFYLLSAGRRHINALLSLEKVPSWPAPLPHISQFLLLHLRDLLLLAILARGGRQVDLLWLQFGSKILTRCTTSLTQWVFFIVRCVGAQNKVNNIEEADKNETFWGYMRGNYNLMAKVTKKTTTTEKPRVSSWPPAFLDSNRVSVRIIVS